MRAIGELPIVRRFGVRYLIYYSSLVSVLIVCVAGLAVYAYHARNSAIRAWDESQRTHVSALEAMQIFAPIKIRNDIGVDAEATPMMIAVAARDFVYRQSRIGPEDTLKPWERYIRTADGDITQVCSGMAQAYAFALGVLKIPARIVTLGTEDYVLGRNRYDTHATVEALIDRRWIVFDPTFNVSFDFSNSERQLSTPGMKSCVDRGHNLVPIKGKTQMKGRTVEDYYLPYEKLLFAYERAETVSEGVTYPRDAFPYFGWFSRSERQH